MSDLESLWEMSFTRLGFATTTSCPRLLSNSLTHRECVPTSSTTLAFARAEKNSRMPWRVVLTVASVSTLASAVRQQTRLFLSPRSHPIVLRIKLNMAVLSLHLECATPAALLQVGESGLLIPSKRYPRGSSGQAPRASHCADGDPSFGDRSVTRRSHRRRRRSSLRRAQLRERGIEQLLGVLRFAVAERPVFFVDLDEIDGHVLPS